MIHFLPRSVRRLRCHTPFILHCIDSIYINHYFIYSLRCIVYKKYTTTCKSAIEYWSKRFKNEDIAEPNESIFYILSHVLNITKHLELNILYDKQLSKTEKKKLDQLCLRRLSRMPIQYIIGEWTFRNIVIKLIPPIFIPRPETEILVDFVIKQIFDIYQQNKLIENIEILEIGCGSGAISLAILHSCEQMNVTCIAIDQNLEACKLTKINARKLGINDDRISVVNALIDHDGKILLRSGESKIDFFNKKFDIIVSNPPYIPTMKLQYLPKEIKLFEDIKALNGGEDGLTIIKAIIKYASKNLKPSGYLFLEIDPTHPQSIQFYTLNNVDIKLKYENTYKDYSHYDRYVKMSKII